MFANHYSQEILNELSKCLRVMPHHQNTSGFFITIIEKLKELDDVKLQETDPKGEDQAKLPLQIQELSKTKAFSFIRADPNDPDIQFIQSYFGLRYDFPFDQLIAQDEHFKKIHFISKAVSDFLYTDANKHQIDLINLGVQVFQRNHSKFSGGECIYRVVQDGLVNVLPYVTKRVVRTRNIEVFKKFIMARYNSLTLAHLGDQDVFDQAEALATGCFVFVLDLGAGNVEVLSMHKFTKALSTMVGKEAALSLQLRYLNKAEQELGQGFCTAAENH